MSQKIRPAEGLIRSVPEPGQLVLPKDGEENILITSALPYCNNVPHLGNIIGSTLSADIFSTLYICGTDEYGTATETRALKEGISPRELCDKYYELHRETYEWFEIGFDYFGRTSTPLHTEISQEVYFNLKKLGYLSRQEKEQTFCEDDQKFLADRFVEGICPHCNSDDARGDQCDTCGRTLDAVELINPRCLLDKTHKVTTRVSTHMKGKWSPNSVINNEGALIDARLKGGLHPSPVTRDLKWGVPVPVEDDDPDQDMKGKVLYVWVGSLYSRYDNSPPDRAQFEACIGYVSITANLTPEWKQWWFNPKNVCLYQFMGKDNVYFHTIYFPSVQLGDGRDWTTLHHLSTTEYLNYEGGKFSKSHNRGVFGPAAKETGIPASVWRYYLLSTRPETADATFSWDDCVAANNSVLLNNFGNFVNRALKFISSQYGGVIPEGDTPGPLSLNDETDAGFVTDVNSLLKDYAEAMDSVKLRLGLQTVMLLSQRGNLYLQSKPYLCTFRTHLSLYALGFGFYIAQLNAPARTVPDALSIDLLPGHHIGTPEHLFKKIEEKMADVWRAKFAGNDPVAPSVIETHTTTVTSKRKAAAAKKSAQTAVEEAGKVNGPKSAEVLALDAKVAEQGNLVRELKARSPRTKELDEDTAAAIAELKKLKGERVALS
ncbi:methionyl-tRNA synthetase [Multifurca ochricompacta]|uniref:methionine--tRNA ligase n=1 Tax=Multifurca ochricompacta TaxID=376703 RepID=A0AAD4M8Z1_9AGAM|nr:methionyl-tRNA synthetase [Multifurca ochricompacta]